MPKTAKQPLFTYRDVQLKCGCTKKFMRPLPAKTDALWCGKHNMYTSRK